MWGKVSDIKENDDFLLKFGVIKFGEESSYSLKDYERSLNNYLKDKGKPRYSEYMSQEKSKKPQVADFEKSFKDYFY